MCVKCVCVCVKCECVCGGINLMICRNLERSWIWSGIRPSFCFNAGGGGEEEGGGEEGGGEGRM